MSFFSVFWSNFHCKCSNKIFFRLSHIRHTKDMCLCRRNPRIINFFWLSRSFGYYNGKRIRSYHSGTKKEGITNVIQTFNRSSNTRFTVVKSRFQCLMLEGMIWSVNHDDKLYHKLAHSARAAHPWNLEINSGIFQKLSNIMMRRF